MVQGLSSSGAAGDQVSSPTHPTDGDDDSRPHPGVCEGEVLILAAAAADLDRSFYVEVETGKHSLAVERLFAIADALQVPAASLLADIE